MRYTHFYFENFKGIKRKLELDITGGNGKPYCLIGDNEAGKTTILKGIQIIGEFCKTGKCLKNGELVKIRPHGPSFTGVTVLGVRVAYIGGNEEVSRNATVLKSILHLDDTDEHIVQVEFRYDFYESRLRDNGYTVNVTVDGENIEETRSKNSVVKFVADKAPDIVYFDDFDFDVPSKVRFLPKQQRSSDKQIADAFLNSDENKRWNSVFDDLISTSLDNTEASIQTHLLADDIDRETVDARVDGMAHSLNKYVAERWQNVVGEEKRFKDFIIRREVTEGFTDFRVAVDATTSFPIGLRSKGFKWFFCFILMTEMRKWRSGKGLLLLLDEPANNIFFKRQSSIFSSILSETTSSTNETKLIYSTHSVGLVDEEKTVILCCKNEKDGEFGKDNISVSEEMSEDGKTLSLANKLQQFLADKKEDGRNLFSKVISYASDKGIDFLLDILTGK